MRLFKRGNTYYIEYRRGKKQSLGTSNKTEAAEIFKILQREYLENKLLQFQGKDRKRLSEFKDEYLKFRATNHPSKTVLADKSAIQKALDLFGNIYFSSISVKHLDQYKAYLRNSGLQYSSCNVNIRHFKTALKFAHRWKYHSEDMSSHLKQYKVPRKKKVFCTPLEVQLLIYQAQPYDVMKYAIPIQAFTGCGRAEICESILIDHDSIVFTRVKTRNQYSVKIHPKLKPYLEGLPMGINKIVPWKHTRTYSKHFEKIAIKAGLPHITPHALRRSLGQFLFEAGTDWKTIAKILGHSDDGETARRQYSQNTEDLEIQAINNLPI